MKIAGVVFNRTGSGRHVRVLQEACARHVPEIPILGFLPRHDGLFLPRRHLGLIQASEHQGLDSFLDAAAGLVSKAVSVKSLLGKAVPWPGASSAKAATPLAPLGQRIAIASDQAFRFSYPLVIGGWRTQGSEVSFFSPLADESPAPDADSVYLPGGYPQLHGGKLAAAGNFLDGLRRAAAKGAAIYGECGGYMTLGRSIEDKDGQHHQMAGLLPLETSFARRQLHLGYRCATILASSPLGMAGTRFRGHEFHYATLAREGPAQRLFQCVDAEGIDHGQAGLVEGRVFGSFIHLIDGEEDD